MTCIGVEYSIGLLSLISILWYKFRCWQMAQQALGRLRVAMEGQHHGINVMEGAYGEKTNGVDSQLISVGVAHDCGYGGEVVKVNCV